MPKQDVSTDALIRTSKVIERAKQILRTQFAYGPGVVVQTTGEAKKRINKMSGQERGDMVDLLGADKILEFMEK